MSCDMNNVENLNDYEDILGEISTICFHHDAEYMCIGGDMNTDLSRERSWHTGALKHFVDYEN